MRSRFFSCLSSARDKRAYLLAYPNTMNVVINTYARASDIQASDFEFVGAEIVVDQRQNYSLSTKILHADYPCNYKERVT